MQTRTAWLKLPHAPGRPGNVRWRDHVDGYAGDAEGSEGPVTSPPGWEISYSTARGSSSSSSEARCAPGRT